MICWSLNLNVIKVQSNFNGRTNSGFEFSRTALCRQASACSSSRSYRTVTSSCTRRASCVFMRFVPFTCVPLLTLCIHKCTRTLSLFLSLSLCLSLSLSLARSLFLSLCLSHTHKHTLTYKHTHTQYTHTSNSHH